MTDGHGVSLGVMAVRLCDDGLSTLRGWVYGTRIHLHKATNSASSKRSLSCRTHTGAGGQTANALQRQRDRGDQGTRTWLRKVVSEASQERGRLAAT